MPGYKSEKIAFEAPADWEDRTIVAFAAPTVPGKFSPNVVLTKDTLKPGETLRAYSDKQIMELARRLEGFDLIESGDCTIAGTHGMEYRFSWKSEHAELQQHSVLFLAGNEVMTLTGTTTEVDAPQLERAMEHVMATMHFPSTPTYSPSGGGAGGAPPMAPSGGGGWSRS